MSNGAAKGKPIWKTWWFWAAIIILLCIFASCGGNGSKDSKSTASQPVTTSASATATTPTPKTTTKSPQVAESPKESTKPTAADIAKTMQGKEGTAAVAELKKDGFLGTLTAENGTDMDESRLSTDKEMGIEWVVTSAGVKDGKVNLTMQTRKNIEAKEQQEREEETLSKKLSTTAALAACRTYGKNMYPYGFKTHDIMGVIQDFTPKNADTWFYKATVDVTNEYGATAKGLTYECSVTGTTASPQVIEFNVY